MVLKLKTFNEALGQGWIYLDGIEKIEKFPFVPISQPNTNPVPICAIVIHNTPGAQDGSSDVSFDCMNFFVYRKGEEATRIYTELPAYILNDEGKTIERLN